MKKYFLDANVVIDFYMVRHPFYEDASSIFSAAEKGEIHIAISMITIPTLDYFCKKQFTLAERKIMLESVGSVSRILPSNERAMYGAINSKFTDLEDAMQNHIAESNGYKTIITRNKRDFKKSNLAILTPEEFLATL